jgi:hypothetical protein
MTVAVIADRAKVTPTTVSRIANRPQGRCWNVVADAVLAIEP